MFWNPLKIPTPQSGNALCGSFIHIYWSTDWLERGVKYRRILTQSASYVCSWLRITGKHMERCLHQWPLTWLGVQSLHVQMLSARHPNGIYWSLPASWLMSISCLSSVMVPTPFPFTGPPAPVDKPSLSPQRDLCIPFLPWSAVLINNRFLFFLLWIWVISSSHT